MKKFASILLVALAAFVLAPAAFAQAGTPAEPGTNWVAISASFGMALAAAVSMPRMTPWATLLRTITA